MPEDKPPEWDIDMSVQAAPFNVMLTCYTLFERDRCGLPGVAGLRGCRQGWIRLRCIAVAACGAQQGGQQPWQTPMLLLSPLQPLRPRPRSPEQRLDRLFLEKWRWSHLIMDEAHALKNRNASRTTRQRRIANASRRRIMMTGACRLHAARSTCWSCGRALCGSTLTPAPPAPPETTMHLPAHPVLQARHCRTVRQAMHVNWQRFDVPSLGAACADSTSGLGLSMNLLPAHRCGSWGTVRHSSS